MRKLWHLALTCGMPRITIRQVNKQVNKTLRGRQMATIHEIIVRGRDNWTEARLDAIEKAASGKIVSHSDDSCGNMAFAVRPSVFSTKADRKLILEAVQVFAPISRWS